MWKNAPAGIRTHDPSDSRLKARQGIYSTIISSGKLQFFSPGSQVRRGINKALYGLDPHYRDAFNDIGLILIVLRT